MKNILFIGFLILFFSVKSYAQIPCKNTIICEDKTLMASSATDKSFGSYQDANGKNVLVQVNYNLKEGKVFSVEVTCADSNGKPSIFMSPTDYFNGVKACINNNKGNSPAIGECTAKLHEQAVSDCMSKGGSHCWMK
jgi:hypothetical protein